MSDNLKTFKPIPTGFLQCCGDFEELLKCNHIWRPQQDGENWKLAFIISQDGWTATYDIKNCPFCGTKR